MNHITHALREPVDDGKVFVPDDVRDAVRTLLRWTGDDPAREWLIDTPTRVARAWRDWCRGTLEDPATHLDRTFEEVGGYDEIIVLRDIPFHSHCEHHMAPIIGKASIAYLPRDHVVGISKLARVLHGFARRLQIQERLTAEFIDAPTALAAEQRDYVQAATWRSALGAVRAVDAGAIAATTAAANQGRADTQAIAAAIRAARVDALRKLKSASR